MLWWDLKFIEKLKVLGISIDLFTRFKDDCNIISEGVPQNVDYDPLKDEMVIISSNVINENSSSETHTASVLNKIADSIDGMIAFTNDVPSNHNDGFLPVLDVKVKLQNSGRLIYQFYKTYQKQ